MSNGVDSIFAVASSPYGRPQSPPRLYSERLGPRSYQPKENMAPSKEQDTSEEQPGNNRKKRLSRREQKARKKQRKQQEQKEQLLPSQDKLESKKKKEEEEKEGSKRKQASTKESKPKDIPSAATNNNQSDAWKVSPVQEDIPYVPTPIPDLESTNTNHYNSNKMKKDKTNNGNKTLGKWFPKARVIKSRPSATEECTILLFYQYKSPMHWSERKVGQLIQYLQAVAEARPTLGGRLRVAPEGINATISCGDAQDEKGNAIVRGRTILEHFTKDLQQFDPVFEQTDFKYIPAKADRHFKDLKVS